LATKFEHLQLTCGNPNEIVDKYTVKTDGTEKIKNPASFTRFIFPFAYKLNQTDGQEDDGLFYEEQKHEGLDQKILLQRKKYFTRETATCLYRRARWFQIPDKLWTKKATALGKEGVTVRNSLSGCEYKIRMSPPSLVLFEWEGTQKTRDNKFEEILHTGFLICEVWFPEGRYVFSSPKTGANHIIFDDLLDLNELFRSFDYPNYQEHWNRFLRAFENLPSSYNSKTRTIKEILAKRDPGQNHEPEALEKAKAYFLRWANLLRIPVKTGDNEYFQLVSDQDVEKALNFLSSGSDAEGDEDSFLIYSDYRAFVWSLALLEEGGTSLGKAFKTSNMEPDAFGHWIRFLNVDPPERNGPEATGKIVSGFERQWARERTYQRWKHFGAWYGFNYHAGVAVMSPMEGKKTRSAYPGHFREIYFDIILLLLYLRISLFRFSNALATTISHQKERLREIFKDLRDVFNKFTILYQFPLLSNQQQAIEMYCLARKHFDIDSFYNEIKTEIDNTHEYQEMVKTTELGKIANLIAKYGLVFAVTGIVASLFGMDTENLHVWDWLHSGLGWNPNPEFWTLAAISASAGFFSWKYFKGKIQKIGKNQNGES